MIFFPNRFKKTFKTSSKKLLKMDWEILLPSSLFIAAGLAGIWISFAGIAETFVDGLHAVSLYTLLVGAIFFPGGLLKDGLPSPKGVATAIAALVLTTAVTLFIMLLILSF